MQKTLFLFLGCLFFLIICSSPRQGTIKTARVDDIYDYLYPYYIQVTAVSQIKPIGQEGGGASGHVAMYLKGASVDDSVDYPRLKLCDADSTDLTDGNSGVGVSVNKEFKNINWVATPTKDLFYFGNLDEDQTLTQESVNAAVQAGVERGLFENVKLHDQYMVDKPEDMSEEAFVGHRTLGTDFALTFGRNCFSVRLPMTRTVLGKVIEYLNSLNEEYFLGEADYNWSGYADNCAHTVHNSLAHAGVWTHRDVRTTKLKQIFNLAIPANEFANLARWVNDTPIDLPRKIFGDEQQRFNIERNDWLPIQHGALLETFSAHQKNEIYDPAFNMFVLEPILLRSKSRSVNKMFQQQRYTNIEKNLNHFQMIYKNILENQDDSHRDKKFAAFSIKYYAYIEKQHTEIKKFQKMIE